MDRTLFRMVEIRECPSGGKGISGMVKRGMIAGLAAIAMTASIGCCGPCGGCNSLCNWYPGKHLSGLLSCGGGCGASSGCNSCGSHGNWDDGHGPSRYYGPSAEPTPVPAAAAPSGSTTRYQPRRKPVHRVRYAPSRNASRDSQYGRNRGGDY